MPLLVSIGTNQFFSATILKRGYPFVLVESWRQGRFHLITSIYQRNEIDRVLRKPDVIAKYGVTDADRDDILLTLDEAATWVHPLEQVPVAVRDSKDVPILAAALGGNAGYLVTGDTDLLVLDGDPRLGNLRIVTARDFLDILHAESNASLSSEPS